MIEQVAGWVRRHFWPRESFLETSNGSTSAGKPIVLNRSGLVDQTMLSGTDLAEYVADTAGAMVTGNTETGITVTYQDADNTIDFEVSAEFIADTVGAMLSGNTETGITVTYDDTDNTIDFDAQTAGDARYVQLTGNQTVAGVKTFSNGIAFANETLSTYDTGSWTPVITGSTGDPTLTYTTQVGRYTRIGDVVFYNLVVVINTISAAGSGDVRISIPLADGSTAGCPGVVGFAGVDIPGTAAGVEFRTRNGQAYGRIVVNQDNAAQQILSHAGIANGDSFIANGHYFV